MAITILLQLLATVLVAAGAYFTAGYAASVSALLGGFAYIIPTIAAVSVLSISRKLPSLAGVAFMFAEGLKTVLALILMLLLFYFYHQNIVFIPFILGMIAASHLVFLISWKVQKNGK